MFSEHCDLQNGVCPSQKLLCAVSKGGPIVFIEQKGELRRTEVT